nr:hypothetical protein [uncultured Methanospirillum sp.]
MKTHKRYEIITICLVMISFSLCILPVAANPIQGVTTVTGTTDYDPITTSTIFDGSFYHIKNDVTGKVLVTISEPEFQKRRSALEAKYRITGPDSYGRVTYYDPITSRIVRPDVSEMISFYEQPLNAGYWSGSGDTITISDSVNEGHVATGFITTH